MNSAYYFILTASSKDSGGRNVITLSLSGESGYAEALISNKPVFFVKREISTDDLPFIFLRKETALRNFNGDNLDALYFSTRNDAVKGAEFVNGKNISTYESDVDPVKRYLMEKSIYGSVKITGRSSVIDGKTVYMNPLIEPAEYYPVLATSSVDIETDGKGKKLYCIGIHTSRKGNEESRVFMIGDGKDTETVTFVKGERELLTGFLSYIRKTNPDVITGWHVIGFDLMFLEKKCSEYNIPFSIGRNNTVPFLRLRGGGSYYASVPGRLIIDAPSALRSVYFSFDDYKLETVAQALLGEGKTISPLGNKVQQIDELFNQDKLELARYNLQDAVLVNKIIQRTGLLDLFIKRSLLSGLLIEQIGMMTAAFDHIYLPELHRRGFAAPDVKDIKGTGHAAGGYVIEPVPGIYEDVIVLDFKSLYPSIIMTFKIDPLSRLLSEVNSLTTPVNLKFSSTEHILPGFIRNLMLKREEAKKKKDKQLSTAIKLLMNSFYGVMGSYGCRFYHSNLPNAITGTGQWLLLESRKYLNQLGFKVIYGDTDSLFVLLKEELRSNPDKGGEDIALNLNNYWTEELQTRFGVQSYLEIEYEKHYKKFILTPVRGAETGAKKRYAGLLIRNGEEVLEFIGMESIRSDWTNLAKEFQHELYSRIFRGEEPDEWIRNFTSEVKQGFKNDKLVYRKRIRKEISEYKNLPPQVRAARMISSHNSSIKYVMTLRGPVPVELPHQDIDYQHYIEKQLKPVADSVLTLLGKTFDAVINPQQLNIFD